MTTPPDRIDALPQSLIDLAETLGLRVAVALIEHFGGLELRIPKNPPPDHPILTALGREDGLAVCRFMGGLSVYIPRGGYGNRWRQARDLSQKGLSRGQIARILGVSQRHVRRLANGAARPADHDSAQKSLFDPEN